jgi:hydrogenase/urease accessory protein HupE
MGYKLLGFVVWRSARWYVGRRYGKVLPSRRVALASLVGVAVLAAALAGRRNSS